MTENNSEALRNEAHITYEGKPKCPICKLVMIEPHTRVVTGEDCIKALMAKNANLQYELDITMAVIKLYKGLKEQMGGLDGDPVSANDEPAGDRFKECVGGIDPRWEG